MASLAQRPIITRGGLPRAIVTDQSGPEVLQPLCVLGHWRSGKRAVISQSPFGQGLSQQDLLPVLQITSAKGHNMELTGESLLPPISTGQTNSPRQRAAISLFLFAFRSQKNGCGHNRGRIHARLSLLGMPAHAPGKKPPLEGSLKQGPQVGMGVATGTGKLSK